MTQQRKSGPGTSVEVSRYLGLGLTWALATLLFSYLGLWLDGRLGTRPWLTLVGAFTGGSAGFYYMYHRLVIEPRARQVRRDGKDGR
jgi:hypothetical protein